MAKRRYAQDELLGPAPQPSFLSQLGSGVLSGISTVGNILDVPGSMVRDAIGGQNPFDQLLTPHRPDNRLTGRDLLRQGGLAGPKDNWGNWGAGLATEIALDPLTYLTLGGSALTKTGQAARAAGIHGDELARIASKAAGVPGSIGKREARLTLTGNALKQHAPEAFRKMETYAGANNIDLNSMLNEPLGGIAKFWPTGAVMGSGKTGQAIAKGMDVAGDFIRHAKIPGTDIAPVGDIANLFNAKAMNARNRFQMQTASRAFNLKEGARADVRGSFGWFAHQAKKLGMDDANAQTLRSYLEFPDTAPANLRPLVDEMRSTWETLPAQMEDIGGILGDVNQAHKAAGSDALYAPRAATEGLVPAGRGIKDKPLSGFTKASFHRWEWSHGSLSGTKGISEMGPFVENLIRAGMTDPKDIAQELEANFAHNLPDQFITAKQADLLKKAKYQPTVQGAMDMVTDLSAKGQNRAAKSFMPKDTWKAAAEDLLALSPEMRQSGIYGNHPIVDAMHSVAGTQDALVSMRAVMDHLVQGYKGIPGFLSQGKDKISLQTLLQGDKFRGIKGLSMKVGDNRKGAAQWFYRQLGVDLSSMKKKDAKVYIQAFRKMAVDRDTFNFLHQLGQGWGTPDSVGHIARLYDSWNNLTKAMFTSAKPSFHGRNLPAGQFNNILAEQASAKSVKAGLDILTGKTIEGSSQNPILKQIASDRGIQQLTDEEATKIAQELAFAHEMTGGAGTSIPTHPTHQGGSINDILSDMPGEVPFSLGGLGKTLAGKSGATSWNPKNWRVRGVLGAPETTMPFVAAGEQVGNAIEHMNRFPPFYALLEQGVDPAEAARRVLEAQVGYQNRFYTKTERDVMQRLVLFYKFFRGQVPFTLRMLMENPGGRLAQTLRAVNRSRDDEELIPDWIKETSSVPIGQQDDGTKRYLTGLGLPFEDPLQFAQPSLQNIGMEALSRTNPLIKAPLEGIFGVSTFQKGGPHGGRPLEDLDPALGRTLANIGQMAGLSEGKAPVRFPGSSFLEHVLSNSPLSTVLTSARTATDPRKSPLAKASNLLTGLKVTDVSPGAQDRELRQRISKAEKRLGAKTYIDTFLPKEIKAELPKEDLAAYRQIQALRQLLEERSKTRKAVASPKR